MTGPAGCPAARPGTPPPTWSKRPTCSPRSAATRSASTRAPRRPHPARCGRCCRTRPCAPRSSRARSLRVRLRTGDGLGLVDATTAMSSGRHRHFDTTLSGTTGYAPARTCCSSPTGSAWPAQQPPRAALVTAAAELELTSRRRVPGRTYRYQLQRSDPHFRRWTAHRRPLLDGPSEPERGRAERVESYCPRCGPPRRGADAEGRSPPRTSHRMRDAGLLGLVVPQEYGGLGGGLRDLAAATFAMGSACARRPWRSSSTTPSASRGLLPLEAIKAGLFEPDEIPAVRAFAEKVLTRMAGRRVAGQLRQRGGEEPGGQHRHHHHRDQGQSRRRRRLARSTARKLGCATGVADYLPHHRQARRHETAAGLATVLRAPRCRRGRRTASWDGLGMRATANQGITLKDVFIPTRRRSPCRARSCGCCRSAGAVRRQPTRHHRGLRGRGAVGVRRHARQAHPQDVRRHRPADRQSPMHQVIIGDMTERLETAYLWLRRQLLLETSEPPLRRKAEVYRQWRLAKGSICRGLLRRGGRRAQGVRHVRRHHERHRRPGAARPGDGAGDDVPAGARPVGGGRMGDQPTGPTTCSRRRPGDRPDRRTAPSSPTWSTGSGRPATRPLGFDLEDPATGAARRPAAGTPPHRIEAAVAAASAAHEAGSWAALPAPIAPTYWTASPRRSRASRPRSARWSRRPPACRSGRPHRWRDPRRRVPAGRRPATRGPAEPGVPARGRPDRVTPNGCPGVRPPAWCRGTRPAPMAAHKVASALAAGLPHDPQAQRVRAVRQPTARRRSRTALAAAGVPAGRVPARARRGRAGAAPGRRSRGSGRSRSPAGSPAGGRSRRPAPTTSSPCSSSSAATTRWSCCPTPTPPMPPGPRSTCSPPSTASGAGRWAG